MGRESDPKGFPDAGELVRRLQAGSHAEDDFRRLFRRYYRVVHHFFSERGLAPQECENLAQETFLAVYVGLPGFRHEAPFEGWLFGIARKVLAQSLRQVCSRRRWGEEVPIEEAPEVEAAGVEDPFERTLSSELRDALGEVMAGLPDQMRRCAELRFQHGLAYREIAESLGISVDAVRVQLARARKRLRHRISSAVVAAH